MSRIVVGLGSNVNEPLRQLKTAFRHFADHPDLDPINASHVYLSAPQGPQDQPDFHNAAVLINTTLPPRDVMAWLLSTEQAMGRTRLRRWGERCIDLDLLLYDKIQMDCELLTLPHPRAHERRFVLDPLIELLGEDYDLPGRGPLHSLRSQCAAQTIHVFCEFPR